jgi:serine/threonine-protein kinase RsbW
MAELFIKVQGPERYRESIPDTIQRRASRRSLPHPAPSVFHFERNAPMAGTLKLRLKNDFAELERLQSEITQFLQTEGASENTIYTLTLALEEMVTNIVKYGYDDSLAHEIEVDADVRDNQVRIAILDDGHAFDPLARPEVDVNKPIEDRDIGGLGIHLVRKMLDEVGYERRDGKNIFRMRKQAA